MLDGEPKSLHQPIIADGLRERRIFDPRYAVNTLIGLEKSAGLLQDIYLQMVVGSGGMALNGLLSPKQRVIKDLDVVTITGTDESNTRFRQLFDAKRKELGLCNETSDVFTIKPATGETAQVDGLYPLYNIIHMLTWARPHIVSMSDHFRKKVLFNACSRTLSNTAVSELPPDYLVAAASIGGLLEKDLTGLSIEQIRELVDFATEYKMGYYLGKHTDADVKTSSSLPSRLKWGGLAEKLSSFGIS